MTTLVTFRLDDEDASAFQYREGSKGVYRPQYGPPKTKRIPAEPVAVRREYGDGPSSNSTLTAADSLELRDLILDAFTAVRVDARASIEDLGEAMDAQERATGALWKFIHERVDDIHERNRLAEERDRAEAAS